MNVGLLAEKARWGDCVMPVDADTIDSCDKGVDEAGQGCIRG
jgi:hypothetical protein